MPISRGAARHEGLCAEAAAGAAARMAGGGGRLEIQSARHRAGRHAGNATGMLALTQRGPARRRLAAQCCGAGEALARDRRGERRARSASTAWPPHSTRSIARCRAWGGSRRRRRTCRRACWAARQACGDRGQARRLGAGALYRRGGLARADPAWASAHRRSKMPGQVRDRYDVAIIGGGHNGLVCAAYLATAGLQGHGARAARGRRRRGRDREFHPGFRNSVASYTVSLLNPKVIADLGSPAMACGSSSAGSRTSCRWTTAAI